MTPAEIFPLYAHDPRALRRLSARWAMVIEPALEQLQGAHLVDIGAHDGRWAYAFAKAGAATVTAVEPRADLVGKFATLPTDAAATKVRFVTATALDYLTQANQAGQTCDVVALLGFLYHTIEHHRLLTLIAGLRPKLIIIDSEFVMIKNPMIQVATERTDNPVNAVGTGETTLVGTPSMGAMNRFAQDIGYQVLWPDFDDHLAQAGQDLHDYNREGRKKRRTCFLLPQDLG